MSVSGGDRLLLVKNLQRCKVSLFGGKEFFYCLSTDEDFIFSLCDFFQTSIVI